MRILFTGGSGFIGTNAIEFHRAAGDEVLNVDLAPPLNPAHRPWWRQADVFDRAALEKAFTEFAPEAVVHLAARTDTVEDTTVEAGYRVNTAGSENVLAAIKATPSIQRVLMTSSQFVCGPGYAPAHDEDFHPVTVYGESKAQMERATRAAGLSCVWTITRPTNIWGPWHERYRREFWHVVEHGWYVHPAGTPVIRCYGYVGNLVRQMRQLLLEPEAHVHEQVFYLGDPPGDILRWANAFSLALRGQRVRTVPRPLLAAAGLVGDAIGALTGRQFYINTSRFLSMTTDYLVNMDRTFRLLGDPPLSLEQGVAETVAWLRQPAANPA